MPCRAPMKITRFHAAVAAAALIAFSAPALAAPAKGDPPVTEAALAAHIKILADDAFEGRAPGTEAEDRPIASVVAEWEKAGLLPVPDRPPPWAQPFPFLQ